MAKQYSNGVVNYAFQIGNRSWAFNAGSFTLYYPLRGKLAADKVANIMKGSIKRSGALDNLARANIKQVTGI